MAPLSLADTQTPLQPSPLGSARLGPLRPDVDDDLDLGMRLAGRMLDGAQDHVTIRDLEGRHVYVNAAAAAYLQMPPESILGRTTSELFPGPGADRIERGDREMLRSGVRAEFEETLTRNGVTRTWLTSKELIRDPAGTVQAIGTLSRDITDGVAAAAALARADEARNESARLLGAILDSMSDHICLRGLDDRFLLVNRLCAEWYGVPAEAMVGRTAREILNAEQAAATWAHDLEILATGLPMSYEETLTSDDVTRTWLTTRDLVRDSSGRPIAHLAVSREITELRRAEQRFHEAQKMESIGRLAGGVAHDFNNLLTIISGNVELLLADLGDHPGRSEAVEIASAADRAAMVTRQLLAFSRRQVLAPEVLDMASVIADISPLVRRLVGADIAVQERVAEVPGLVRVDRTQLEQVLLNLAINGRDAMPSGGRLTISMSHVHLDATEARLHPGVEPGPFVELGVTDTGIGIAEDVRGRIFEPFFTTKETGKGTGLGLSMVEGIVRQSGGDVWVESEPGIGTTFRVYLPLVSEPTGPGLGTGVPSLVAAPSAGDARVVLIVEDQPGVRDISRRILAGAGYTVLTADGLAAAIEIIGERGGEIDLLLADVVMPGGSGPDVARALAEVNPAAPVVYMSGYTNDALSHEGTLATGVTLVLKPFSSEELLGAVGDALVIR